MPTAVERLLDSFLNFDTSAEQVKLGDAFQKIDEAFQKLSNRDGDGLSFAKVEHDLKLHETFGVVGGSFLQLGADFHQVATAEHLTDEFVNKLMGDHKGRGLPSEVEQDFHFLEFKTNAISTDLKIVGVDFITLDSSRTADMFDKKADVLSSDFLKLGGDTAAAVDAFKKLGGDFLRLGKGGEEGTSSPLDLAYKEFGGELLTIGQTLDTLSADFAKLGDALHNAGGGDGAGDSANIGKTLSLIFDQFHLLDGQFAKMGDGSVRLIDALSSGGGRTFGDGGNGGEPPVLIDSTSHHGGGHG